jgi:hypothetical protein
MRPRCRVTRDDVGECTVVVTVHARSNCTCSATAVIFSGYCRNDNNPASNHRRRLRYLFSTPPSAAPVVCYLPRGSAGVQIEANCQKFSHLHNLSPRSKIHDRFILWHPFLTNPATATSPCPNLCRLQAVEGLVKPIIDCFEGISIKSQEIIAAV